MMTNDLIKALLIPSMLIFAVIIVKIKQRYFDTTETQKQKVRK